MLNLNQTELDLTVLKAKLVGLLSTVPDNAWDEKTGERDKDWTLHQTLAHLVSIARLFNRAADAAMQQKPLLVQGLESRHDLAGWNAQQIALYSQHEPVDLRALLADAFGGAAARAMRMTPSQAEQRAYLRVYNRPARAIDFLDWQISHAGVIHAAQLVRPLRGVSPLWARYDADFLHRTVDRFMRHFSYAYWPEYATSPSVILNFRVEGEGGGAWHLIGAVDGGAYGVGLAKQAAYTVTYASAAVFFGVFTVHLDVAEAIDSGAVRIETHIKGGDVAQALRVLRLFAATPPRGI